MNNRIHKILLQSNYKKIIEKRPEGMAGDLYHIDNDNVVGKCIVYNLNDLLIVLRNNIIKREIVNKINDIDYGIKDLVFISGYLNIASGEWFKPYRALSSKSTYVISKEHLNNIYLLHKDSSLSTLSLYFSKNFISKYIKNKNIPDYCDLYNPDFLIIENNTSLSKPFQKIYEYINNNQNTIDNDTLIEYSYQWLDLIVEKYKKLHDKKILKADDLTALSNISDYINDHFSSEIDKTTLEKISMMNLSRLKIIFKKKYGLTINEYIQKRRIHMAEVLLLTTNLDIKDIAVSVGYASHSRFSTLYKKYKGMYPKDLRKRKLRHNVDYEKINSKLI